MDRMKTFFTYAILFVAFFAVSLFLENGLVSTMYSKLSGQMDMSYSDSNLNSNGNFSIENISARASNLNGYISFDLINTTGNYIEKCYLKIDLYNSRDLLASTKYVEILSLQPNESRRINVKFKANNIERFNVSIVQEMPDKSNIIDILGWEIDLSNVFGLGIDLTNVSIFGYQLKDLFDWSNWNEMKTRGIGFFSWLWNWFKITASGVPLWGYFFGWLFIVGLL